MRIRSIYKGTCAGCGNAFPERTEIEWFKRGPSYHLPCWDRVKRASAPPRAPSAVPVLAPRPAPIVAQGAPLAPSAPSAVAPVKVPAGKRFVWTARAVTAKAS